MINRLAGTRNVSLKWQTRPIQRSDRSGSIPTECEECKLKLCCCFGVKSLTVLTMLWAWGFFSSLSCFSIHRVSFVSGPSPGLRQHEEHQTFPSENRMKKRAELHSLVDFKLQAHGQKYRNHMHKTLKTFNNTHPTLTHCMYTHTL